MGKGLALRVGLLMLLLLLVCWFLSCSSIWFSFGRAELRSLMLGPSVFDESWWHLNNQLRTGTDKRNLTV